MTAEVSVVIAAAGGAWELPMLRGFQRRELGIRVLRRCSDVGELLGTALRDLPHAVIVDANLEWLDRDVVTTLRQSGIEVFAIGANRRALGDLGVRVFPGDVTDEDLAATLNGLERAAVSDRAGGGPDTDDAPGVADGRHWGRLLVVWSGPGAPGRTTVALHLAVEAARAGQRTLLVDADAWAASIAQLLELDESPSVAQAARAAATGWSQPLADFLQPGPDGLMVLVGLPRADLWSEVTEGGWRAILAAAQSEFDLVVLDIATATEEDEELVIDHLPVRRNLMTTIALDQADRLVLVAAADPVGLRRAIVAHRDLAERLDDRPGTVRIVLNRAPRPGRRLHDCSRVLGDWVGDAPVALFPEEDQLARVVWEGRPLHQVAPRSRWLRELRELLAEVTA